MKNRDSEPARSDAERARNWWYRTRTQRLTADRATESLAAMLDTIRAEAAAAEREACIAEAAEPLVEADTARDAQRVIVGRLVVGKRRGNHSPEERRRESDTTAPSDLRCIFCGNPYGNGHSPRCSVTKLGAPEQWWSPPPERERAPLYERSEIEAELIAEAFGVRDGIVEGKVAADAVITIRRLHAVAEAAREVVETARTYGLGQSLAWGGPNPEFPKSNWGKFELAVCRLMAIVPTDSSGEGHDHG